MYEASTTTLFGKHVDKMDKNKNSRLYYSVVANLNFIPKTLFP